MPLVHEDLADRSTLLGRAQRGQGGAYREMLAGGTATFDVLDTCTIHDPRIDTQLDSRASFYGSLYAQLDAPVGALDAHLEAEPEPERKFQWVGTELAVSVLVDAALRGHTQARLVLAKYARHGAYWSEVAHDFASQRDAAPEIAAAIIGRFASDEELHVALRDANYEWLDEPLTSWTKNHPRLEEVAVRLRKEVERSRTGPRTSDEVRALNEERRRATAAMSTTELLDMAEGPGRFLAFRAIKDERHELDRDLVLDVALHGSGRRRDAAIRALGARQDEVLLDFAPELVTVGRADNSNEDISSPQFAAYLMLQEQESPAAVDLARTWVTTDNALGHVGWTILSNAGEPRDEQLINDAYGWLNVDDIYLVSSVIDNIREHGRTRCLPVVREVYRESSYDHLRHRCVKAMLALDHSFVDSEELGDCLWDASAEIRRTALLECSLTDTRARRIGEMRDDPFEDDHVVEAARERLQASSER